MRRRSAIIALVVVLATVLGGGWWLRAARQRRGEAERLLRAAFTEGTQVSFVGEGKIGLLMGGEWVERRARIAQARGRRCVGGGDWGRGAALLMDGETVWRLDARRKVAVGVGPMEGRRDWELLLRNYRVRAEGEEEVAGRMARRLAVLSRRRRQPAMRVWVDPSTKVALRTDNFDTHGRRVARALLESVDFSKAPDDEVLQIPEHWRKIWPGGEPGESTTVAQFAATAHFTPLPPTHTPRGYQSQGLYSRTGRSGRKHAEFRYRDGLRTLSVFERRPPDGLGPGGPGFGRGPEGGPGRGMGRGPRPPDGRGPEPGPGRGEGRRFGRGPQGNGAEGAEPRGGRGQGPRLGRGPGPYAGRGPGPHSGRGPALIDQGATKSIRQMRGDLLVVVTGDLSTRDLWRVLQSVPEKSTESQDTQARLMQ